MDRLKRFALKKVADGLDKVLEAKAHFDKRESNKAYSKKIVDLKHVLNELIFHGQEINKMEAYDNISILNRMQTEHELSNQEKLKVDALWKKYQTYL